MFRLAPLALGITLGLSALTALSLPALAQRHGGGGHFGGGGGHFGGGGGHFGGGAMMGGGGFGGARFGPMAGVGGARFAPGFTPRPGFVGRPGFVNRPGFVGRPGFAGRPVAFNRFNRFNRWGWRNGRWWGPGVGVGIGLAGWPYWGGYDDSYGYGWPYSTVGFDVGYGGVGGTCSTPVRVCQLYDAAPVGTGCSCRTPSGRARGVVSP